MDEVVAVAVTLVNGDRRYFMTWGRIQDAVDEGPLVSLVRRAAARHGPGDVIDAALCTTLQDARDAPYFYEALWEFANTRVPRNRWRHAWWRRRIAAAMEDGSEMYYLGAP